MATCEQCGSELRETETQLGTTICLDCRENEASPELEQASTGANDWDAIALDSDPDSLVGGDGFAVSHFKPKPDVYCRFHPTHRMSLLVYEASQGDDDKQKIPYIGLPFLLKLPDLRQHFRKSIFMFGVDANSNPFIWFVRANPDGRVDGRVASVQRVWQAGIDNWIQIHWARERSEYDAKPALGKDLPDPVFPEKTRNQWLDAAFPDDRIIRSESHPIIRRLRGLEL